MSDLKKSAEEFVRILESSRKAYAITGAGISVPSGIPDFRGPNGLYKYFPPDIFDIDKFFENPKRYYDFSRERLGVIERAQPNTAHEVLAELEEMRLIDVVITQNIDGLHRKAGSKKVIELHGNLEEYVCTKCGRRFSKDEIKGALEREDVPHCETCGGLVKPNVVFFGEPLPERELLEAFKIAEESDLAVAVGTSLVVYPAALVPRRTVETGGRLVIINVGETGLDGVAYRKYEYDVVDFFREVKNILVGDSDGSG